MCECDSEVCEILIGKSFAIQFVCVLERDTRVCDCVLERRVGGVGG